MKTHVFITYLYVCKDGYFDGIKKLTVTEGITTLKVLQKHELVRHLALLHWCCLSYQLCLRMRLEFSNCAAKIPSLKSAV